tara:strand:+ start:201 stop:494 length:294 start_codon:yes stop_codon:yes gene_type:complete
MPANKETAKYDFVDCVEVAPTEKKADKLRDKDATDLAIIQMQKAIGRDNQHLSPTMDRLARDAARHGIGLTIRHLVVDKDGVVWNHSVHDNVIVLLD